MASRVAAIGVAVDRGEQAVADSVPIGL